MKKKFFSIISMLLVFILGLSMMAMSCGGGGTTPDGDDDDDGEEVIAPSITYGYSNAADTRYKEIIADLAKKWNDEQYDANNPIKNFKVYTAAVESGSAVTLMGNGNNADLMEIYDENSQEVIVSGKAAPINTNEVDVSGISATALDRYYSGTVDGKFSPYAENRQLYAVPIATSPAMLFYNEAIFKRVGITIISMTEEQALREGFGAYGYHVYNTLPEGYSGESTTYNEIDLQGNQISDVTGYRVFNNKVPMSIEELYALSAVLTEAYNEDSPTETGFNSEYWFPLGWTVGGDCLSYNESTNKLEFSLADDTPNYLVTAHISIPGGDSYEAGEILSYSDKKRVVEAISAGNAQVNTAISGGVLYAIPSTQEVFSQFIAASVTKGTAVGYKEGEEAAAASNSLEQIYGYGVAYNPTQKDYVSNFEQSQSAMILRGYSVVAKKLIGTFGQGVNICPTPQYKEYNTDGTIKIVNGTQIKGYRSTWDETYATYLNNGSQKKDEAITFLKWLMEDAQQMAIARSAYYITTNTQGANALVDSSAYKAVIAEQYREGYNVDALLEAAKYCSAPDWTYTSDNGKWVNTWSKPLNEQVRTGKKSIYYLFYATDSAGKTIPQLTDIQVQGEEVKNIEIVHHKTFQ